MKNELQDIDHLAISPYLNELPDTHASQAKETFAIIESAVTETHINEDYKNTISNVKIMLISDEIINAEVMHDFLTDYGYTNIIVTDALLDAFEMVFQERPDAILFENSALTPHVLHFLTQIRNNAKTRLVPLLILTTETDEQTKLKALELGVVDVIYKPASANELALRLRNILSVKTYHDQIANFDSLTKLPNRETFINRVDRALKYSKRYNTIGAVLQVGFNRFKNINDALGIAVGDQLLKAVAERIKHTIRENDIVYRIDEQDIETTISRLGGNGFTILLPIIAKADDAAIVSLRLHEVIIAPYLIDDSELFLECNIGISTFPEDGQSKDLIINAASAALSKAQSDVNIHHAFYSKEINARSVKRLNIENNLRRAIIENQFEMYFQPKVSIKSKKVIGAEALIRWQHPELGNISPQEFISVAEESDNIYALGRWVIHAVVKQIQAWKSSGLEVPRIAINISSHQFSDDHLLPEIENALDTAGLDASSLIIELTETAVKDNIEQVVVILNQLKALGAKVSIDDFGTGYSSLAQLKQLPLDELKIDRFFTMDIGKNKNTEAIILAIISLGQNLGLNVIAEGVETEEQLQFLMENDCDEYQGYLFSPAIPASEFSILLA